MSLEHRGTFANNAVTDEASGEQYLNEQGFIDAIAPQGEDYVGITYTRTHCTTEAPTQPRALLRREHQLTTRSSSSTKSNATNTRSSSLSPTVITKAASPYKTGLSSTTSSLNRTPSMKSPSASSPTRPPARSTSTASRKPTRATRRAIPFPSTGTAIGRRSTWVGRNTGIR